MTLENTTQIILNHIICTRDPLLVNRTCDYLSMPPMVLVTERSSKNLRSDQTSDTVRDNIDTLQYAFCGWDLLQHGSDGMP